MLRRQPIAYRDSELLPARTAHRILEGLAVPYGQPTDVGGYLEEFAPGAFTEWIRAKGTTPLLMFHDSKSLAAIVGHGVYREDRAGLWGIWELRDTPEALEAADLAAAGILGLSIGFMPKTSTDVVDRDGTLHVTRTAARLLETSLTPVPSYVNATVTNVRHATTRDLTTLTPAMPAQPTPHDITPGRTRRRPRFDRSAVR